MKFKIYIPCCDDSLPIVKINSYLFNKFWPQAKVVYMGFKEPEFDFYSENHEFVSLAPKQEGGSNNWTRYMHEYIKTINDDVLMFSIDDYLLCTLPDEAMLNIALKLISKNDNIGRFDLTFDSQVEGNTLPVANIQDYQVHVKHPSAPYRISTQPALWKREYLLKFLDNNWSPWQFELNGTSMASKKKLPEQTFCFYDKKMINYPVRTIAKGAVSRHNPGKFNVLGLNADTIKELVDHEFVSEDNLIWGQHANNPPSFHEKGGYDFHPYLLSPHETSKTNWKEYEHIYKGPEKVNLFDKCFSHTKNIWGYVSSNGNNNWGRPKTIEYVLKRTKFDGTTIFTDHFLGNRDFIKSIQCKRKVAWICEPPVIHPWSYKFIDNTHDLFDLILTYDINLTKKYKNCKLINIPGTLLQPENCKIHEKTKLISLIAANKKMSVGHRFRFEVADKLSDDYNIDLWGSAFKKFVNKEEAIKDYCFSITIHNCKVDDFYTEALVDCFLAGTIPIFWGCPNIENYFDAKGIIQFNTIQELEEILKNLSFEMYKNMIPHIKNNFEIAKKHQEIQDDQVFKIIKGEIYEN